MFFERLKEVVGVRKGWLTAGVVVVLLAIYVFVLKPYYFDAGLSEEKKQETSQALETIIKSAKDENAATAVESDQMTNDDGSTAQESAFIEDESEAATVTDAADESDIASEQAQTTETDQAATDQNAKKKRVEDRYIAAMEAVQTQAESLLDDLINEAKFEYQNLTAEEKDDFFVTGKLASKYMARANELEAMIDEAVESLLADMKAELSANGFSTESVEALQESYEAAKKARREELLTKALNYQP
jgi:hypothetical protein